MKAPRQGCRAAAANEDFERIQPGNLAAASEAQCHRDDRAFVLASFNKRPRQEKQEAERTGILESSVERASQIARFDGA